MNFLKTYKTFESSNIEMKDIKNVFRDLSDIMIDWEDKGTKTDYLLTNKDKILLFKYNPNSDIITSFHKKDSPLLDFSKYGSSDIYFCLTFENKIKSKFGLISNEEIESISIIFSEVYNRIKSLFNVNDIIPEVYKGNKEWQDLNNFYSVDDDLIKSDIFRNFIKRYNLYKLSINFSLNNFNI